MKILDAFKDPDGLRLLVFYLCALALLVLLTTPLWLDIFAALEQ